MIVFVADDEKMVLSDEMETIANVLPDDEMYGFRTGAEVLEKAKETPCDIAFLDIHMMDTTGIDLAAELKKINPKTNIIFVTAYDDYYKDAMQLHASGYLLKPICEEDIEKELEELRYDVSDEAKAKLKVFCFGNFDVRTPDGEIVHFERSKAKEAFAYLVNMNGRPCTLRELAAALFEDEPFDRKNQLYIQKIVSSMVKTLKDYDVEDVLEKSFNSFSVHVELLDCDYYKWQKEEGHSKYELPEDYMQQYTWAIF